MILNKSLSAFLICCFLIGASSVDAQGYLVEAAIKPTPGIKSSESFSVVSSIEPVERHGSSLSFIVSGDITYGTPEQTVISPVVPVATSTPPVAGSSSGGGHKYDASNWVLDRKYTELAANIFDDDEGYTSAPKKREPLPPFPVDEFEEPIPVIEPSGEKPIVEASKIKTPIEKALQTNIFKPQEKGVIPVKNASEVQSFEKIRKSIEEGDILNLPGSLFVTTDLEQDERMFPLSPRSQVRVVFTEDCKSCSNVIVGGDCFGYFIYWLWGLIILIFINLSVLFWQLLIVNRLILNEEKRKNKFKTGIQTLWNRLKTKIKKCISISK